MNEKVKIITSERNWMEHSAIVQLEKISQLPGVTYAIGLPDLHAGKSPVGIAVETENIIYPHLIGNDIGCGMGFYRMGIPLSKYKADRFVSRLNNIRALEDIHIENPYGEESPIYDLGTIGGGNHFVEFQRIEDILDEQTADKLELRKDELLLLVHSGSRSYGQRILSQHPSEEGYLCGSAEASSYLASHDNAMLWARRNRLLVAEKVIGHLGFVKDIETILDCFHNFIDVKDGHFIHRKGAVSALAGPVIIPGSRGSLTYIVKPTENTDSSLWSLSHGAGRKWARSLCKSRIKEKYDRDSIRQTKLKSRVVCHDTELLFQEAPEAYKNIEHVIDCLVENELIEIVATLRPLLTFK